MAKGGRSERSSRARDAGRPAFRPWPFLVGQDLNSPVGEPLATLCAAIAWPRTTERATDLRHRLHSASHWDALVRLAERHRVVGLLGHALKSAAVVPPDEIAAGLAFRAQQIAFQELALANELGRLTSLLAKSNIAPIVLKGLTVAAHAYRQIGLRQNFDIDLLVEPYEVAETIAILEAQGYQQIEPADRVTGRDLELWMRSHKEMAFAHSERRHVVELHWRLLDNHLLADALEDLKAEMLELPTGTQVRSLPPEASFLYMAAHGAQHAWSRLKWLADFHAMAIRLQPGRVSALYELHRCGRVGPALAQGLRLSEIYFGARVPERLHQDLMGSWRLRSLVTLALRVIDGDGEIESRVFGSTLKTLSHYLLHGGLEYWLVQASLDFSEVPKGHTSPWRRRFGPLAKAPLWIIVRLRRSRSRSR